VRGRLPLIHRLVKARAGAAAWAGHEMAAATVRRVEVAVVVHLVDTVSCPPVPTGACVVGEPDLLSLEKCRAHESFGPERVGGWQ
jgi:hypothetical protein